LPEATQPENSPTGRGKLESLVFSDAITRDFA
jgi:hypothetical protein